PPAAPSTMQPNNWQQQQYSYQNGFQPQQTGFRPQQQPIGGQGGMGNSYLSSQPTGFAPQQQQQPMQTGYGQAPPRAMTAAPTGAPNFSFLNQPPPSSFQQRPLQSSFTGGSGLQPQMTGYPAGGASGLISQQTGYPGMMPQQTGFQGGMMSQPTGMGRLQAQPTGLPHDPRLQSMMQSFMPSNTSQVGGPPARLVDPPTLTTRQPFLPSGVPQFNPAPSAQPLQQTFQSLLQNPTVSTPKVPWTLSKQEKKDYDQIFRAWDQKGDGFISGEMSREVFGQSGLGQDDLMKIWNLSDVDNRGKLNLPEFHIAMGLIYRALNGNTIPDKLPEELVPPSMRDIDTTVTFMKNLLKHESTTRSNTSSPSYGAMPAAPSKDAKVYKHDDTPSGYKSSSRHLDRKAVRYAGEDSSAEIGDLRRQLANTSALLDRSNDDYARKSEEDELLEQEVDDLKRRVKRIQEDIEYVSRGKRTAEKDEDRRKLERELLFLMHEKLPEVERRQEEREEEKKRDERLGNRARDKRNDTHSRYSGYDDDREDDRGYMRGTFDRERERDRDRNRDGYRRDSRDRDHDRYRERSRDRSRERDYRPRSPPPTRAPPPAPPAAPKDEIAVPPPPPPAPAAAVPSTKNMTPEERTAYIRAQAQQRIQDRLRALGVESAPADTPTVDKSVEERLTREKQEAEEKTKAAEAEQEKREEARKKRIEGTGGDEKPAAPTPAPIKSAMKKPAPPAPAPRSKAAPPPPTTAAAPKSLAATAVGLVGAGLAAIGLTHEEDAEEKELREKEEARQKAKADRAARLKRLEEEEEEERKKEEEVLAARKARSAAPPAEPVSSPPAAPPAPPAPSTSNGGSSYNPFHRKQATAATPSPAGAPTGGFNPFFKPPNVDAAAKAVNDSPAAPPPPPPPAPAPAFAAPKKAFSPPPEEDWDVIQEKQDDSEDSSDEEYASSRNKRGALAQALFGGILPSSGSRPGSAGPTSPPPAPAPPKSNPAALAKLGGDAPPQSRGALFAAIQGGARLKKAVTVDKSAPPVSGKVVGDSAPPAHINAAPTPAPDSPKEEDFVAKSANRQSVDWYAGLASETSHPSAAVESTLPTTREEDESTANGHAAQAAPGDDDLSEFDLTKEIRVRTLFPYEGQRDADLSFIENVVILAHPAKDESSPWWYGTLAKEGKKGWFPHSYVEEMQVSKAKALYAYTGEGGEELPFEADDILTIVDKSDENWWKTEKAGVIFIVPAAYLEVIDPSSSTPSRSRTPPPPQIVEDHPTPTSIPAHMSPKIARSRPVSMITDDGGDSSSDDSFLSWNDSDSEPGSEGEEDDGEKEAEKKRREEERQKVLNAAGLKLRREPPGVPLRPAPSMRKRRPAPAAPRRKEKPYVTLDEETPREPEVQTQDAYARYERFLEESNATAKHGRTRAESLSHPRPASQQLSPQLTGSASLAPSTPATQLAPSVSQHAGGGRLTGFLSRMMAPQQAERKAPAISGPITRAEENGVEEDGFGQTWSSLVEPSVLETMGSRERKRQEAIFEFIATESAYVRDLQLIVGVFYASMLDMLEEKALTVIFANIEDILLFNTGFLSSLEQRQKSCRLYIDVIGDVLAQHISSLAVYMPYCVNQQQAIGLLQSLRQSKPELAEHLQITHYTEPDQDLASITESLRTTESIVASVNESVREAESQERLRVLSEDLWIGGEGRLDLTAPTAYQGPRRLLKEGPINKAKSGKKLVLVLCNDILVLVESRNLYRMPIPLHEMNVRESRDESGFVLKLDHRGGGDTIGLKASGPKEAQSWILAISGARKRSLEARKGSDRRSRASSLASGL
ncbi:actin cytoskeleton-regulatory complex protein PAN1, partial [Tremellales sp. Uapishka_1]